MKSLKIFFFTNFMGQFLKNVVARVLATTHFGLTTSQAVILHKICFFAVLTSMGTDQMKNMKKIFCCQIHLTISQKRRG